VRLWLGELFVVVDWGVAESGLASLVGVISCVYDCFFTLTVNLYNSSCMYGAYLF